MFYNHSTILLNYDLMVQIYPQNWVIVLKISWNYV